MAPRICPKAVLDARPTAVRLRKAPYSGGSSGRSGDGQANERPRRRPATARHTSVGLHCASGFITSMTRSWRSRATEACTVGYVRVAQIDRDHAGRGGL